jgi:hypothetical protein
MIDLIMDAHATPGTPLVYRTQTGPQQASARRTVLVTGACAGPSRTDPPATQPQAVSTEVLQRRGAPALTPRRQPETRTEGQAQLATASESRTASKRWARVQTGAGIQRSSLASMQSRCWSRGQCLGWRQRGVIVLLARHWYVSLVALPWCFQILHNVWWGVVLVHGNVILFDNHPTRDWGFRRHGDSTG